MRPDTPDGQRADGYSPKWRNFHPMDRVWVQNPFNHDVVFQVADEYNRPMKYRLPANKVSELPGGAIATLGVKAIVDELIQSSEADAPQLWNPEVRKRHEAGIILREKRTMPSANSDTPGEVNLAVDTSDGPEAAEEEVDDEPETRFPGLNESPEAPAAAAQLDPLPAGVQAGIDGVVGASLPARDAIVEEA
jgi:hypothetical protein